MNTFARISLLALWLCSSTSVFAELSVNVGAIHINPDSSHSAMNENTALQLTVDSNTQLGLTIDYMLDNHWGLELVAATPFSHDINGENGLAGVSIGNTKHLPPTLLAQYHFLNSAKPFRPFVGVGINYTLFFDESVNQQLKDVLKTDVVDLKLDNSLGFAAQIGFNYRLEGQLGIHAMLSYIDIDSDAEVYVNGNRTLTTEVSIDPIVAMLGLKYRF